MVRVIGVTAGVAVAVGLWTPVVDTGAVRKQGSGLPDS